MAGSDGRKHEVFGTEMEVPGRQMNRRNFVAFLSSVLVWPRVVHGQQSEPVRLVAMLNTLGWEDPEAQARIAAFEQALQELGWVAGRNLKIEIRQNSGDFNRGRSYAAELVQLAPDVIFTIGSLAITPLQQATSTIPIVFVNASDPVGAGFVQSMAHPGGNITGFSNFEYSIAGKWAELLRQIAPHVTRALTLRDPSSAAGIGQFAAVRSVAQSLGVELTPVNVSETDEIERNVAAFARSGGGGMIVTAGGTGPRRKLIIDLASRYKLPAVYPYRYYAVDGGLITYGPNTLDPVRRAARYVDRILKGEKPGDLPVQAPTKYELVINLKTAKTLGLSVPQSLLATADEVID
jgi:putative ABC transport system substrate-binding protein